MKLKSTFLQLVPYIVIIIGFLISSVIYYMDIIEGGGQFWRFGTSIFISGIYLVLIGVIFIISPSLLKSFYRLLVALAKEFKYLIIAIISFLVITTILHLLGNTILIIMQIPIFPIYLLNLFFGFFFSGVIPLTLSFVIGIPLTSLCWIYILKKSTKGLLSRMIPRENELLKVGEYPLPDIEGHKKFLKIFLIILGVTYLARILLYLYRIPGYDTGYYLAFAKDFMKTGSLSSIFERDFFAAFPIFLLSLMSGFQPNYLTIALKIYTPMISTLTNLLFMLVTSKIVKNKKITLYAGMFYALSPVFIQQSTDIFKNNFAILLFMLGLFLYYYVYRNRNLGKLEKHLGLISSIITISFALLYFYLLLLFILSFLVLFYMYKHSTNFKIILVFLNGALAIGVVIVFIFFKKMILVKNIYDLIYFTILLQDASPLPVYSFDFFSILGTYLIYTPFLLFGTIYLLINKKAVNQEYWKQFFYILILMGVLVCLPLFGGLPINTRILSSFEYILIIISCFGIESLFVFIRYHSRSSNNPRSMKKSPSILRFVKDKRVYLGSIIIYLTISYALNYPDYSSGFLSSEEEMGLQYLEEHEDTTLFSNSNLTDTVIVPNKALRYWVYYYFSFNATSNYPDLESLISYPIYNSSTGEVEIIEHSIDQICSALYLMFNISLYLIYQVSKIAVFPIDAILMNLSSYSMNYSLFYENDEIIIQKIIKI